MGVVKFWGLLFFVIKSDVMDFFWEFEFYDEYVYIMLYSDGRIIGEVFVDFGSVLKVKFVMNKDKMMMGSWYVEIFFFFCEEVIWVVIW